jgi:uncharacterized membrane protein
MAETPSYVLPWWMPLSLGCSSACVPLIPWNGYLLLGIADAIVMPAFDIRFVSWDCCNEFLDVIDNRELLISASYAFCMEACVVLMFACSLVSFRADASFRDIEDAAEAIDASLDACLVAEVAEARLAD